MDKDLYPTYSRNEPGIGLVALPKAEAEWIIKVLERDNADYKVIPNEDPKAFDARIALNACESKRTRAHRKTQKLVTIQLPYTQDDCDDIMISFSQYPLGPCYPQHLENALGLKLREPSDDLQAIAEKMSPDQHGTVFGAATTLGYIGWLLVNRFGVNAIIRDRLTLDERIRANTLYLENHRKYKTFSNDTPHLRALDVPLNQNACDHLARSLISVPLLPDAIICAAYDHRIFNLDREPIPEQPPRLTPIDTETLTVDELHTIFGDAM